MNHQRPISIKSDLYKSKETYTTDLYESKETKKKNGPELTLRGEEEDDASLSLESVEFWREYCGYCSAG